MFGISIDLYNLAEKEKKKRKEKIKRKKERKRKKTSWGKKLAAEMIANQPSTT